MTRRCTLHLSTEVFGSPRKREAEWGVERPGLLKKLKRRARMALGPQGVPVDTAFGPDRWTGAKADIVRRCPGKAPKHVFHCFHDDHGTVRCFKPKDGWKR